MKCAHCGASRAGRLWLVQLCADKRKKRRKYLCDPCDDKLNEQVLKFFSDPLVEEKMQEYKGVS